MIKHKKPQKPKAATTQKDGLLYHTYIHYLFLIAGCFLLYGWTSGFDFGLDDDYILIYLVKIANSWSGLVSIFKQLYASSDYRPVTILSFWIERSIFDSITPLTAHLVNVLLFAGLLVGIHKLVMVSKFIRDEKQLKTLALITAGIFLVHPNHVSVVANIKSRDNILSMLFGVLAAIQLIKAYDLKQYWRVLFFIFFIVAGIFSKLDSYSFIFYPAMVLIFFRDISLKKIGIAFASTILLFLVAFGIRSLFTSNLDQAYNTFKIGVAESPLTVYSTMPERLSLALTSVLYYLKFLFIPFGYYFYYGYNQIPLLPLFSFLNILSALLCAGMFAWSILQFKKNRIYLFSFLFFFLSIAYALNFLNLVAGIVMDRYNFIPSLAFCIALSSVFLTLTKQKAINKYSAKVIAGILVILAAFTVYRTAAWKNSFTLFDSDLPHLTKSVNANRIAAGTYIHLALEEEMKNNYDKNLSDSFINKGERYALVSLKNSDKTPQVWELLGLCDLYRKNDSGALIKFQHCFMSDTSYLSGVNYLGFTYWNLNRLDSAIFYFNYAIRREPMFNYAANNLVNLLVKNNRRREADSVLNELKKRYPEDERLNKKIQEVQQATYNPIK